MAIALRGTAKSSAVASGADVTLTFDTGGGAPQQGDVVLLFGGHGNDGASGGQGPNTAGYTQRQLAGTTGNVVGGFWYKVMGATPDASVVCEGGADTGDGVAYCAVVLDGTTVHADIFDNADVLSDHSATGNPGVPDCSAIVVNTVGTWVLAFAIAELNDATPGVPTNYEQLAGPSNFNDTDPASITLCKREVTATGSEDPSSFSGWASDFYVAITVAIKPASGPQTVTPSAAVAAFAKAASALTLGTVTVLPGAAVGTFDVPDPTVVAGQTSTPASIVGAFAVSAPTVLKGAVVLLPSAGVVAGSAATPAVIKGTATLLPSAALAAWGIPDPVATMGQNVTPAALVGAWAVAGPAVIEGPVVLLPSAAAIILGVSSPALITGSVTLTPNAVTGAFVIMTATMPGGTVARIVFRHLGLGLGVFR